MRLERSLRSEIPLSSNDSFAGRGNWVGQSADARLAVSTKEGAVEVQTERGLLRYSQQDCLFHSHDAICREGEAQ